MERRISQVQETQLSMLALKLMNKLPSAGRPLNSAQLLKTWHPGFCISDGTNVEISHGGSAAVAAAEEHKHLELHR